MYATRECTVFGTVSIQNSSMKYAKGMRFVTCVEKKNGFKEIKMETERCILLKHWETVPDGCPRKDIIIVMIIKPLDRIGTDPFLFA